MASIAAGARRARLRGAARRHLPEIGEEPSPRRRRSCLDMDRDPPGEAASMYLTNVDLAPSFARLGSGPKCVGCRGADLRATTGVVVDEGLFYHAARWF